MRRGRSCSGGDPRRLVRLWNIAWRALVGDEQRGSRHTHDGDNARLDDLIHGQTVRPPACISEPPEEPEDETMDGPASQCPASFHIVAHRRQALPEPATNATDRQA